MKVVELEKDATLTDNVDYVVAEFENFEST